jgi:peptide/nickel transport system ATP-binding protein
MNTPILELRNVNRVFKQRRSSLQVLFDVSLQIMPRETLCIVGESGCGKTTTGKILAGLNAPSSGQMFYQGKDVSTFSPEENVEFRRAVQIVHQDPYASLNPVHSIYKMLSFPLFRHGLVKGVDQARTRVSELLKMVDLTPDLIDKYPHQLSGGQRQRVSIARALTVNPKVIVADEAVSMVDVSIRISLLNTLSNLQRDLGVTFVFITHDLAVARYFAWEGRIAVMYLGRVIEQGPAPTITSHPQHPYTRTLISAIPEPDPEITRQKQRLQLRSEDIPSLARLPSGCAFHPRCPAVFFAGAKCEQHRPELMPTAENGVQAACHVVGNASV